MAAEELKEQVKPSKKKHLGIPEAVFLVCALCSVSDDATPRSYMHETGMD